MHVTYFFCPGEPGDAMRKRYASAMKSLPGHEFIWITPAGASSVFDSLARQLLTNGSVVDGLLKAYPPSSTPTTLSAAGFSAGCWFMREMFNIAPGDIERLDGVVQLDGLHGTEEQLDGMRWYARRAQNSNTEALLWVGHTDVKTYGAYNDTTQSAEILRRMAGPEGGSFQINAWDLHSDKEQKKEHGAALTEWGATYVAQALVPHLGALGALRAGSTPDTPAWRNPALTLGARVVLWSQSELVRGRLETTGRNAGPRIAKYFRGARRRDQFGNEKILGLTSGDWCVAARCYGERQCLLPGEFPIMPWRVSGIELERDARRLKLWRPVELVRSGEWFPEVGDAAIFVRPPNASPKTEWRRHGATVLAAPDSDGAYRTIDGNQGDRWAERDRHIKSDALLGFIEYPRAVPVQLDPGTWERLTKLSDDVTAGRDGLDHAMSEFELMDLVS